MVIFPVVYPMLKNQVEPKTWPASLWWWNVGGDGTPCHEVSCRCSFHRTYECDYAERSSQGDSYWNHDYFAVFVSLICPNWLMIVQSNIFTELQRLPWLAMAWMCHQWDSSCSQSCWRILSASLHAHHFWNMPGIDLLGGKTYRWGKVGHFFTNYVLCYPFCLIRGHFQAFPVPPRDKRRKTQWGPKKFSVLSLWLHMPCNLIVIIVLLDQDMCRKTAQEQHAVCDKKRLLYLGNLNTFDRSL